MPNPALRRLLIACLLPFLALAGWALWWEPDSLTVREQSLLLPRWPASLDGLRIVQLTDLHVGSPWIDLPKVRQIVARSNALKPDLIVLTGDYVITDLPFGHFVAPEDIAPALSPLHAPLGVFAVLGNHDCQVGGERVTAAMNGAAIPVLENSSVTLEFHGRRFSLVGFGGCGRERRGWREAVAAIPRDAPVIALTHFPHLFAKLPASIDLTLAGHTHGGQVSLPLLDQRNEFSEQGSRYAIDRLVQRGNTLFVSSGIGTSVFPIRCGVPPEISVLTLRSPERGTSAR